MKYLLSIQHSTVPLDNQKRNHVPAVMEARSREGGKTNRHMEKYRTANQGPCYNAQGWDFLRAENKVTSPRLEREGKGRLP
jgi:hypothetical protein